MKRIQYLYILILFFSCTNNKEKVRSSEPRVDYKLEVLSKELSEHQMDTINESIVNRIYGTSFRAYKDSLLLLDGELRMIVEGRIFQGKKWTELVTYKPSLLDGYSNGGLQIECDISYQLIVDEQHNITTDFDFVFYAFEQSGVSELIKNPISLIYEANAFLEQLEIGKNSVDTFKVQLQKLNFIEEPVFEYKAKINYEIKDKNLLVFTLSDRAFQVDSSYFKNLGINLLSIQENGNISDTLFLAFDEFKSKPEIVLKK